MSFRSKMRASNEIILHEKIDEESQQGDEKSLRVAWCGVIENGSLRRSKGEHAQAGHINHCTDIFNYANTHKHKHIGHAH